MEKPGNESEQRHNGPIGKSCINENSMSTNYDLVASKNVKNTSEECFFQVAGYSNDENNSSLSENRVEVKYFTSNIT
jgi:hypothetical protein